MKFLSSSASSTITTTSTAATTTTTTTTSSFDGNNNVNNSKSATAGCIAGVFRRLLCLNSLPTYPSDDHFRETELLEENTSSVDFDIKAAEVKIVEGGGGGGGSTTPNIVARLMGLESLPQIDHDLLLTNDQKNSAAISRSRSMNYVDTVLKELHYSKQGKHRRAKSFRETSTFLDLDQDENFLILSFENNNGAEKMKLATKAKIKSSPAEKTKNQRREQSSSSTGNGKNKENQETKNGSDEEEYYFTKSSGATKNSSNNILRNYSNRNSKPPIHAPQERDIRSNRRKKTRKSKDESLPVKKSGTESSTHDDDSENSSPNSVLDNIMDFPCDPEDDSTISGGGGVSRLRNSKTRRTLTEELENYRKLNGQNLIRNIAFKSKAGAGAGAGAGKCVQLRRNYDQIRYVEISRMAEKETVESNWVGSKIQKLEDCNEEEEIIIISAELEFKIVDQLVNELVVDLLPGKFS